MTTRPTDSTVPRLQVLTQLLDKNFAKFRTGCISHRSLKIGWEISHEFETRNASRRKIPASKFPPSLHFNELMMYSVQGHVIIAFFFVLCAVVAPGATPSALQTCPDHRCACTMLYLNPLTIINRRHSTPLSTTCEGSGSSTHLHPLEDIIHQIFHKVHLHIVGGVPDNLVQIIIHIIDDKIDLQTMVGSVSRPQKARQ